MYLRGKYRNGRIQAPDGMRCAGQQCSMLLGDRRDLGMGWVHYQ